LGSLASTPGIETPGAALGSLTGYYPDSEKTAEYEAEQRARLLESYELRTKLRTHAADERIAVCGTRVFGDPAVVCQELGSGERRAHWSGVILCNRAGCSVCGAVRARKFGDRVRRTLAAGGTWQHVIATVPHRRGDSWASVYERLLIGLQDLSRGKAGKVHNGLLEASIRATETTWSARNGWHVHFHLLFKIRREYLEAEKMLIREQWSQFTNAALEHGLRFGACFDCDQPEQAGAAASYVSKLAAELSGHGKRAHAEHWTMGEVFRRAAHGEPLFVGLLREYQTATKGRRIYQLDRRAKLLHDQAPELPELVVVQEWRTTVERAEFSGLSRAERFGREPLAVYLPLEVAIAARGDPAEHVCGAIDDLLRAFDTGQMRRVA
jgi:hypothetical protein